MEKLLIQNNWKLFLITIFIVAFFVRFFQLGSVPSSMHRDEPAIGYNAFSILKIGRDEWGFKFPLTFKSFGDYKSPLYIYLTTIPVSFFGLNEFSVRFWGAMAGFLLVIVSYLLTQELLEKKDKLTPILVAFLMAVGSWQIFYSRFSFEANLGLLLNVLILYFMARNNFEKINLPIIFFLGLSLFTYSSALIIWPIYIFFWSLYLLRKQKIYQLKEIIKLLILFLFTGLIFYSQIKITGQKNKITVFDNPQIRLDFNTQRLKIAKESIWKARLFYNQYLYYGKIILVNYLKSFNLNFLFGGGGEHPWHKIPQTGHFYKIYFPLIILGIFFLFRSAKISKEKKYFLILFFLLSPIPSAITTDSPHATRLLNFFCILTILAGLGLYWLYKRNNHLGFLIFFLILFSFLRFTKYYFGDFKKNPPAFLLPGIKESVNFLKKNDFPADKIIFYNHTNGSYAYFLFYFQYPPSNFLKNVKHYSADTIGFEWVEEIDKYVFTDYPVPNNLYKEIYITPLGSNLNEKELKKINSVYTGQTEFTIYANF